MGLPEALFKPVRARVNIPRRSDRTVPHVQHGAIIRIPVPVERDDNGDILVFLETGGRDYVVADCLDLVDTDPWWAPDTPADGTGWSALTQRSLDAKVGGLLSAIGAYEEGENAARALLSEAEDAVSRAEDRTRVSKRLLNQILDGVRERRPDLEVRSYWT